MKKYSTLNYLGCVSIFIVTCMIMYVLKIKFFKGTAINVDPDLLFHVLKPGNYTGISKYTATDLYKNGLKCTHDVHITKTTDNGISVVNIVTAYDANTSKIMYTGRRIVDFSYKPNHDNNLFKISQSYIDNKLVSSSYGYATGKTKNSISFNLSGSWHISKTDYTNIYNTITRSDDTIDANFTHLSFIGLNKLVMDEKYTMV